MVQGRTPLTRRSLALAMLVAVALDGCVTYPSTVATKGQDAATGERDAHECRKIAEKDVVPPLAVGLGTKLVWALGGAVLGVAALWPAGAGNDPQLAALVIGGAAGLGFVVGSIAGTFKGADEASRAARARERVFAHCMTERGYQLEQ
ncbi:MAG: hypothetical protein ACRELS_11205 [Candidatus Rokuibacteriota bacterium]